MLRFYYAMGAMLLSTWAGWNECLVVVFTMKFLCVVAARALHFSSAFVFLKISAVPSLGVSYCRVFVAHSAVREHFHECVEGFCGWLHLAGFSSYVVYRIYIYMLTIWHVTAWFMTIFEEYSIA